jgi:hypothetical protein
MIVSPPPRFTAHGTGWLAILIALLAPWIWTAVLDRFFRGKR